jgi:CRISPR-associated endonuclease/helicase Cas3
MLTEAAKTLWGKSDRDKNDGQWHPLICHMVDVVACSMGILEREPQRTRELYARDLGFSSFAEAKPWLMLFISLHDVGKASPSFQSLWKTGAEQVNSLGLTWTQSPAYFPHGFISQYAFEELEWKTPLDWDVLKRIADAVACHHGLRATHTQLRDLNDIDCGFGSKPWMKVRQELFDACIELFSVDWNNAPALTQFTAAAFERLAGLCSFADWLGSNQDFFLFEPEMNDLGAYWKRSVTRAENALDQIGWTIRTPLKTGDLTFSQIFPFPPRPLQSAVFEILEHTQAPTMLLIEAPMGEGKTEAAFHSHLILQKACGHRGLYLALPTRATGNAMYKRTVEFINSLRPQTPVDLQLLHGSTLLNDQFQNLRIRNVDEQKKKSKKSSVMALEWFSNKKRGLLSEYGVGTVDQALMGILPVKHQFVRIWGLGNRTIVIDEVHAYDVYTSSLIEVLLRWLHALGSSVIVMSATLPRARREALLKAYGGQELPKEAVCYPRVFKVSQGVISAKSFPADPDRAQTVELVKARADIESIAEKILESVENGGCAACITNTVQRAQDLYRALELKAKALGITLKLFHARYPAKQRQKLEEDVLRAFGKNGQRPEKAILVGSQVLECSLDYDVDILYTDLAPIDLILQRAGRLWRHNRANRSPNQTQPKLVIMGLEHDSELPELNKNLYWDLIYDEDVLLRSYALLRERSSLHMPADIDELVEAVYSNEPQNLPEALMAAIEAARVKTEKTKAEHQNLGFHTVIGTPENYLERDEKFEMYDPDENPKKHKQLQVATRLGEPSVTVIPIHQQPDGKYQLEDMVFSLEDIPDFVQGKRMFLHNVALGRWEIMPVLWEKGVPEAWKEHPLLRNCYPLELVNGKAIFGKLEVSLDDVLGVVYTKLQA